MILTSIIATGLLQVGAPPASIRDYIRPDGPTVERVFYDDQVAVYFGEGMDRKVHWMNDYIRRVWQYMKSAYGPFGGDGRIYVVAHTNKAFNYATINNRFDSGFDYRNVIDLGGAWDWQHPSQLNYEVITHELAHIVEGACKDTKESPSFEFWGDGPWAEIFIFDVYSKIGKEEWAQDWFNRMLTSQNGHYGDSKRYYFFRDWFYPIYARYGGVAVFNRYFTFLSKHFPKKDIVGSRSVVEREYARRATFGEVLHFFSAAANADLREQYKRAFGWDEKIESQWKAARKDFPDLKYPLSGANP